MKKYFLLIIAVFLTNYVFANNSELQKKIKDRKIYYTQPFIGIKSLPPIDIKIEISDKAREKLNDLHHKIKVNLYLSNFEDLVETGEELDMHRKIWNLLTERIFVLNSDNGIIYVRDWQVPFRKQNRKIPDNLLINVSSLKNDNDFNILNCSIYDGLYPSNYSIINIKCDII